MPKTYLAARVGLIALLIAVAIAPVAILVLPWPLILQISIYVLAIYALSRLWPTLTRLGWRSFVIRHRKDRFYPDLVSFVVTNLLGLRSRTYGIIILTGNSVWEDLDFRNDGDVRKIFGSKSGINTDTNSESIFGMQCLNRDLEIVLGHYVNLPDSGKKKNLYFDRQVTIPLRDLIIEDRAVAVRFVVDRVFLLPAFAYAGGQQNTDNYSYELIAFDEVKERDLFFEKLESIFQPKPTGTPLEAQSPKRLKKVEEIVNVTEVSYAAICQKIEDRKKTT